MPIKPQVKTLTNSSVDVLNAIRNSASTNYQDYVPIATANADSVREIGAVIMDYPALQNEFLHALINRIGRVIITSKMYSNPWSVFKKGVLDFGEAIEEIFVDIAKPFVYDAETAESKVFAREMPDVRSAFHILNYQKFYKVTIQNEQLRQAFLSWDGVTSLISKIVDSMYTAAAYDEFQVMKYLLARRILNGQLYPVTIPTVSAENAKGIVSTIKGVSNNFEFMSRDYNLAGVANSSAKNDQYLLVNSNFDATMDVEVLAAAFNMDKAEFSGHRVLVDSFGKLDIARLALLFAGDSTYQEISADDMNALNAVPAVLVDRDFFMIFDNLYRFTENYNGQGLYWNYFYHVWKTFSTSPFANNALFVPGTPAVTAVTVSPSAVNASTGQTVQLSANVTTDYFAPQAVNWSSDNEGFTVDVHGKVTIGNITSLPATATITATSVFDPTKKGTCAITVNT